MPTRREAIGAAALAASALPVLGQQHEHPGRPMDDLKKEFRPEPKVFSKEEFTLLARLADLIIPRTDTPGASDANVPHWIDAMVSGPKDTRVKILRDGFAATEEAARKRFKKPFLELAETQQIQLLTPWSLETKSAQGKFFKLLKDLTIDLYYTSRAGLAIELGYHGSTALAEFSGCTHPEHQV